MCFQKLFSITSLLTTGQVPDRMGVQVDTVDFIYYNPSDRVDAKASSVEALHRVEVAVDGASRAYDWGCHSRSYILFDLFMQT